MRDLFIQAAKYFGAQGGRKCNPRKGFGTGDNARKAVAARWAKYREAKKIKVSSKKFFLHLDLVCLVDCVA